VGGVVVNDLDAERDGSGSSIGPAGGSSTARSRCPTAGNTAHGSTRVRAGSPPRSAPWSGSSWRRRRPRRPCTARP